MWSVGPKGPVRETPGALRIGGLRTGLFWRVVSYRRLTVRPNVRAKRATTAWRAGQQAQNGPQAQRLMAGVTCRWRSA